MTLLFRYRINRLYLSRKDQYNARLKYHDELRHKYYNIYGIHLAMQNMLLMHKLMNSSTVHNMGSRSRFGVVNARYKSVF